LTLNDIFVAAPTMAYQALYDQDAFMNNHNVHNIVNHPLVLQSLNHPLVQENILDNHPVV